MSGLEYSKSGEECLSVECDGWGLSCSDKRRVACGGVTQVFLGEASSVDPENKQQLVAENLKVGGWQAEQGRAVGQGD